MICGHFQAPLDGTAGGSASTYSRTFLVPQVLLAIEGKVSRTGEEMAAPDGKSIGVQKHTVQTAASLYESWAGRRTGSRGFRADAEAGVDGGRSI
jgi:hypothetical protein